MKRLIVFLFILSGSALLHGQERDSMAVFPYKSGSKWTFRSPAGFLPGAPLFDSILLSSNSSFFGYFKVVVRLRDNYGIVQYENQCDTLLPIEYDLVTELDPQNYVLKKNGQWSVFSLNGWDDRKQRFTWSFEELGKLDSLYVEKDVAYFWKNGKMGVKNGGGKTVYSNYSYITVFDKSVYNRGYQHKLEDETDQWNKVEKETYYLVSDGMRFGLIHASKELIPCIAECIQSFNASFCRYWNGNYWIYVRYKDGYRIDPKGESVVFYADNVWKVYSGMRQNPILYLNGIPFPVKTFDDYFFLSKEYIAVRKAGKIGLLNRKGGLLIQPVHEQIDYLGKNLFRVLNQGKWYLSDANGSILTKTGYDFIGSALQYDGKTVFEIHQNGKSGMLWSTGVELLNPQFLSTRIMGDFLFAKEANLVTILGSGGKKIAAKKYMGYNVRNNFLILYLNESEKDLCTKYNLVNERPFTHIADLGEAVKLYSENRLEVLVFNPKRTVLEERQVYPGSVSFKVKSFERERSIPFPDYHTLSYLEENQLSGFFGYRKTFETTHLMKPDFLECFEYGLFDWEIGIRNYERKMVTTSDGLKFASFFDFQIVDPESGKWFDDPVSYTSFSEYNSGTGITTTESILAHSEKKGNFWLYEQLHATSDVKAVNYAGVNSYAYYIGGNYVPADKTTLFAVSNYERFKKMNQALNLAPVDGGIAEFMNPKKYARLTGGRWYVKPASSYTTTNRLLTNQYYSELNYFEGDFFENPMFIAKNAGNWIWNYQKGDSIENTAYTDITPYGDLIWVKANSKYGVCLKNREVLLDPVYDEVYFLSWDLLLVKKDEAYGVMDFNKTWIVPLKE